MSTVRHATAADLPLIGPIEDAGDALFTQLFGAVDWPAANTGEERAAEPGFLLVVEEPDTCEVVGFAHVLDLDGHHHLEQVAVLPEHGRRGHGSALLAGVALEAARRGADAVTLMTYADVPWNGPFYATHGWVELAEVPEHLREIAEAEARMGLERHGRRIVMARTVGPDLTPPGGSRA
ncbi:GNAT family N-acetyltransferase [Oryzobacter telluris]|uniref:GNAT family N-acetyltransferase n=1 Tax=Oryzobacter telluris TaxID=3149179 RepID=UPI00370D2B43